MNDDELDLRCYVQPGWEPRLRAATPRRDWMDETPEHFAYRCLPLALANTHGWELLSPCGFEAVWNGGSAPEDVSIALMPGTSPARAPIALFGQGVLTFHVEGLFRTPPGINLWVGGPPNVARDGIAPLGGLIETDWSPFGFTMNWRFTRPHHAIRFEENEPFCFFFPVERGMLERVRPSIHPLSDDPELKAGFENWSASRNAFQAEMAEQSTARPSDKWQKFYYRGVDSDGRPGPADHQTKLRLAEFAGAEHFHRPGPGPQTCPVATHVTASPARPATDRRNWMAQARERLSSMAEYRPIPRKQGLSAEDFLEQHYSTNRPVILSGEMDGWPALARWTPDYLRRIVGDAEVEVQADRDHDIDYERNMEAHRRNMPFASFIDRIEQLDEGNDVYLTAYNAAANQEALAPLLADLGFIDKLLTREAEHPNGMPWIGGAGSFTPLHHDLTNNLLLQVTGRKLLLLAAPGETGRLYNDHHVYSAVRDLTQPGIVARFPKLHGLSIHRILLDPGDALFIPLGWWHQALALDFGVSISHTNFRWPNDFHTSFPG